MMNFREKVNLAVKPVSLPILRSGNGVSDQFPAGLKVLVVDDDPTCLRILEKMLRNCLYEVTKCNRAEIALKLLRNNKNGYDIVISDVHMPDMDGFKLLEHVGLEMDLPVIMMSADDSKTVVMKGVTHGACDYLIKPVSMEALKNIWQHVIRKKKYEWKEKELGSVESGENQERPSENVDYSSSANEGKSCKKRKVEEDESEDGDDMSALKKPRVVWSVELHQQFVTAVNQLGIDKAVPKRILELMNVPGLTRENVASHLQKYRLYLRRLSCVSPHGNPFVGPPDMSFGLTGIDCQALAASGQLPPQSLASVHPSVIGRVDQRNIFSFENPKHQENNNNKHGNLLYGIPTNMDSKQLTTFGSMNMPNGVLGLSGIENFHGKAQPFIDFSRSQNTDLSGNSFPLVSSSGKSTLTPQFQEVNSGMTRRFVPNYDGFSELNQNRACDWGSPSLRTNVERSVLVHPVFPCSEKIGQSTPNIIHQQVISSFVADNATRIKSESLHDTGFQNSHYTEHFGQEDLMSALLKQQQEGAGPVENEFGFDGYHFDNLPV